MTPISQLVRRLFQIDKIRYRVGFTNLYTSRQWYVPDVNCLIFVNQGATTAVIESMLSIAPGASLSIPGELFEENDQKWNISFTGSGMNNLVIVYKQYY